MLLELFNTQEFVNINKLEEVTSPILFQSGNVPHPEGLISNRIFGVTVQSRRNTFAYIDLQKYFFNPIIFKSIRRMFRNIDTIINGTSTYSIDADGYLVSDENGQTGIDFLYENWEKIKWRKTETLMRNERVDLLTNFKKNELFTRYLIVIPPFYRDIKTNSGGSGETGDLNRYYSSAIRYASLIRDQNAFAFQLYNTDYSMQTLLIDIYDYFKTKLEKKNGLLRKSLLGKNVDYATRTVITAPSFHTQRPEELMVDFRHASIPISQVCSLCYPYVIKWVKDFLDRGIFSEKNAMMVYDPISDTSKTIELDNPESIFTDKWIKKTIDSYIKDPESRFNTIEIPAKGSKKKYYLQFTGKKFDATTKREISSLAYRPLTITDILYRASVDVTKDKHCMITRYPLLDEFGIFIAEIRVSSTTETMPVMIDDMVYPWYPIIDFNIPREKIATKFIDSVRFSNSYLEGMGGDYDGDQTTVKILYTQEANEECKRTMDNKAFFINAAGKNIRVCGSETSQTFYVLTKERSESIPLVNLSKEDCELFVGWDPKLITFNDLVDIFGNTTSNESKDRSVGFKKSKYNTTDVVTITEPYMGFTGKTTLGRLIFNKLLIENCGFEKIFGYINDVINAKRLKKFEQKMADMLREDAISVEQMYQYTDMRDWLGLQLHAVICSSFTMKTLKQPPEVAKLKKELVKQHKAELEAGDAHVAEQIEKALIDKTKEVFKDDVGLDLYVSGARGSIDNNLKNMNMMRGPVKNVTTGGYDILTTSLMEGIDKEHMEAHSNSILIGAYDKCVGGTRAAGYLSKQLMAAMQTETLDEHGSDCGTKKTLEIELTAGNKNDYLYRYIVDGGKLICLTPENMEKYVGKTVHMRSPMYCTGDKLCNICAGENFYKLGKSSIGLASVRVSSSLLNLAMKKFHDQTIHSHTIDINDILL